jgi:hypothetical protein
MTILTYFGELLNKNLKENFNNYLINITSSFENPYNIKAYQQLVEDFDVYTSTLTIESYKALITALDEDFMKSNIRKQKYDSKGFVTKPLLTKFGWVDFKRRRYVDKLTGESFMYVDRFLGLQKYSRLDPFVIADLIEEATSTSYAASGRIVSKTIGNKIKYDDDANKYILSRATTRNNVLKASNITNEPINDNVKEVEELNIMLDEKFIGSQFNNGKDHMVKAVVVFEGTEIEYGKRVRLTGKRVFGNIEEGIKDLLTEVLDYIYYHYDTDKLKRINFMGDGALWIKSFILDSSFKYHRDIIIKFGLDAFHTYQAIQHICTNSHKNFYEKLTDYLIHNIKSDFVTLTEALIEIEPHREKRIREKLDYILNNWDYIQNAFHNIKYKCSMESNISHAFADIFSSRPRAYSKEGLEGLLKIRLLKINGYDIKRIYLDSLEKNIEKEKEETILKKAIIQNTKVSDSLYRNVPILNTTHGYRKTINVISNIHSNKYPTYISG